MLPGARVVRGDVRVCRDEVLEADRLGDEEECLLRDHLLAQPETRSVLLSYVSSASKAGA